MDINALILMAMAFPTAAMVTNYLFRARPDLRDGLTLAAAVAIHDIDAPATGARASEPDAPIGSPGRQRVRAGGIGQTSEVTTIHIHHVNVDITPRLTLKGNSLSIR